MIRKTEVTSRTLESRRKMIRLLTRSCSSFLPQSKHSIFMIKSGVSIQIIGLLFRVWEEFSADHISSGTLAVKHIKPVTWNKAAFERLVLKQDKKDLVQAVVMNHLEAGKMADAIEGKGNGLVILLHGGPGTGKTFTAEGVAEIAERPLYRLTCGDIGTEPETVEKSLENIFFLGTVSKAGKLIFHAKPELPPVLTSISCGAG